MGEHEREEGGGRRGTERAVTDKTMVATWLARARQKPNGAQNENLRHLDARSAPGAQIEFETQMLKFLAPFAPEYKNYRKNGKISEKMASKCFENPFVFKQISHPQRRTPTFETPGTRCLRRVFKTNLALFCQKNVASLDKTSRCEAGCQNALCEGAPCCCYYTLLG